jgi:3-dehydroquinate synthase
VLAFGGGVAGDLAGFVAATYLRGIPVVQLPTTLLAMIDASAGGKTGVDVPAGKNLVGAFHQPKLVLADIDWLATLPRTHVAAGMAEAIKHGVIRDAQYFDSLGDAAPCLGKDLGRLEDVVLRSVAIKAEVVTQDERESGLRAILNFGHTVGHAIETLSGYDLLHGEAVSIGMVVESRIAEGSEFAPAGLQQCIVTLLEKYGLPVSVPENLTTDRIIDAMQGDKKARGGLTRFVLPSAIGQVAQSGDGAWTVEVEERVLRHALDSSR